MIFLQEPADFKARFDVAGCFCERGGKILLLLRHQNKPEGNTWGVPAGKVEKGESIHEAMARELYEETGLLCESKNLNFIHSLFVRFPEYDLRYHVFRYAVLGDPAINLDATAHTDFCWVTPAEALRMNLMRDEDSSIKLFYTLANG